MIKFLAPLLSLIQLVVSMWREHTVRQQGREEALRDVEQKVEANIAKAESAVSAVDPDRDERLRSRFDRSRAE